MSSQSVPISSPTPRAQWHLIGDLGSQRGMELAEEYALDAAAAAHGARGTRDLWEHLSEEAPKPRPPSRTRLRTHTPMKLAAQQRLRRAAQRRGCGGGSSQEVPGG